MTQFLNDFRIFWTAMVSLVNNIIQNVFLSNILGEIFFFVLTISIFISILYYLVHISD